MGLGPAPQELKLIEWGRPYGLLPSQFTAEDYRWLALAARLDEVKRLNEMIQDPQIAKLMSKDAALPIFNLRKEAKALIEELSENGDEG